MKVVVFGGSGFLGSHVVDRLNNKGYDVTIYDTIKSPYSTKNVNMVIGDILNQELVQKTVKDASYVYHFAGIAGLADARKDPVTTVKNNVLGTTYILDACKTEQVKRFIFASTIYVYSELGSFYRSTKQSCELLIENYFDIYNLDYTIIRYGSLYGKRANDFNFVHAAIKEALINRKIIREGNGNEIRDYIHVKDAAIASVDILKEKYNNSYILISGSQSIKVKDLLKMINEILDNQIDINYTDKKLDDHYEITPYSFRPRLAKKYLVKEYHDLGQGILNCIYDLYKELDNKGENKLKINLTD